MIRDADSGKFVRAPYGVLESWAGVRCKYEIPGDPRQFRMRWADGHECEGSLWYDALETRGSTVVAAYTEGPGAAGLAAIVRRRIGKGSIILLGTLPAPDEFARLILDLAAAAGIAPAVAEASPNLLVVPRRGKAGAGLVVVELQNEPGTLTLPSPAVDVTTGVRHEGTIELPPYGVMALKYRG